MTYKEFKNRIEKDGHYFVIEEKDNYKIMNTKKEIQCWISAEIDCVINAEYKNNEEFGIKHGLDVVLFAATKVSERN